MGIIFVIFSIYMLLKDYGNKKNQTASSLLLKIGAFCGIIAYIVAFL
jgi:hypothetical protein